MTTVRYLTAAEWGMTWARPPATELLPDPECYVHHVGGQAWMNGDATTVFRNLNQYAITGKGYAALDYDALVHYDPTGDILTIGEGRGPWRSAATLDRNEQGEAIVACGNYSLREPLPVEIEGVALGIVWMIERGWLASDAVILGHRDNPAHPGATGCPGDHLYPRLPEIRARVTELLAPPLPPIFDNEELYDMAAIHAIYKPGPNVTRPNPKWFVLRADGGIRHASGPDVEYAGAVKAPTYTIEGDEHYDQLDQASKASEG